VVPQHEVVTVREKNGIAILVRSAIGRNEVFGREGTVPHNTTLAKSDSVPRFSYDSLHESLPGIGRVEQHHDIPDLGIVELIRKLVDHESVLVLKGGLHAATLHARDLKPERCNQSRVDGGGCKSPEP
jgi:hypothetical protein